MGFIRMNRPRDYRRKWWIKDPHHKVYNDGVLSFGENVYEKVHGKTVGRKFRTIDHLPARVMTIREQDKEFAHGLDMTIDIKLATPYHDRVNSKHLIRFRDRVYNIVMIDKDMRQDECFITLQLNEEASKSVQANERRANKCTKRKV